MWVARLLPAEGGLQTRFDVINVEAPSTSLDHLDLACIVRSCAMNCEVWGCGGVEAGI